LLPRLTFNPGLALTGFRTTRHRSQLVTKEIEATLSYLYNSFSLPVIGKVKDDV